MTFLDSEVEQQLQRHRKEDNIVTLNVGGTRYEVGLSPQIKATFS